MESHLRPEGWDAPRADALPSRVTESLLFRSLAFLLVTCAIVMGCDGGCNRPSEKESTSPPSAQPEKRTQKDASPQEAASPQTPQNSPLHLDLPPRLGGATPDSAHRVDLGGQGSPMPRSRSPSAGPCPSDMVLVAGLFCIDRYEVHLVDSESGRTLSPHYPPTQKFTKQLFEYWVQKAPRSRMSLGRKIPVPEPPAFQLTDVFMPQAESRAGVLPSGYLSQKKARAACENAGKRLCTRGEWVRACRGQANRPFPYGERYRDGICNVHRKNHPASLLHGNSSENHTDPRLGLTEDEAGPLLRRTGATPECVSRWGADGIYDMVGNLDEWVDEPGGTFVGGFYSRATREGCDAAIETHSPSYFDYSLGTRCCRDL